jgi:uncharacterized membrane protein YccC
MRSGFVRLRQRTLGTLIGAAFAAGLLVNFALPWIKAHYGETGVFALPAICMPGGNAAACRACCPDQGVARQAPARASRS